MAAHIVEGTMMIKAAGSTTTVGKVPVHAIKAYKGSRGTAPLIL